MGGEVVIYTDGSSLGNPGAGGWAATLSVYINGSHHDKQISGAVENATNQQMEILAATKALEALSRQSKVVLYTDSKYVIEGITTWIHAWVRNDWKTATGKPVKNQGYWQRLKAAADRHEIDWQWVKGHSGNKGNEVVDRLARDAAQKSLINEITNKR